jgi:Cu2+-exporting ATPase
MNSFAAFADPSDAAAGAAAAVATDGLAALDDPALQHASTRWTQQADGRRLASTSLVLGGIDCAACASPIEAALRAVPGVLQAEVSAAASGSAS